MAPAPEKYPCPFIYLSTYCLPKISSLIQISSWAVLDHWKSKFTIVICELNRDCSLRGMSRNVFHSSVLGQQFCLRGRSMGCVFKSWSILGISLHGWLIMILGTLLGPWHSHWTAPSKPDLPRQLVHNVQKLYCHRGPRPPRSHPNLSTPAEKTWWTFPPINAAAMEIIYWQRIHIKKLSADTKLFASILDRRHKNFCLHPRPPTQNFCLHSTTVNTKLFAFILHRSKNCTLATVTLNLASPLNNIFLGQYKMITKNEKLPHTIPFFLQSIPNPYPNPHPSPYPNNLW